MRSPLPLPHPLPARPFSVAEARQLGVTPRRIRAADLATPYRGVRAPVGVPLLSTADRANAYSRTMPTDQFFSHFTAAELLGLRLPEGYHPGLLHVAAPDRAPRSRLVTGHELADCDIHLVGRLRVTSPIETWCHLASVLSIDSLVIMGDGLLRRNSPIASVAQLQDAALARAGSRGAPKLRSALHLMRPRTDSARETMLRLLVVRAGFPEPQVNLPITNRYGAVIAHGDLVWTQQRVILEYDGRGHAESATQFAIDIRRLDDLMEEEWRVIRVDRDLMVQHATLFDKIRTALNRSR